MSNPSSNETSSIYAAVWAGAVGADINILTTIGGRTRAIRVGKGGTLNVKRPDGTSVSVLLVADGETLTLQAIELTALGSTAHSIVLMN